MRFLLLLFYERAAAWFSMLKFIDPSFDNWSSFQKIREYL